LKFEIPAIHGIIYPIRRYMKKYKTPGTSALFMDEETEWLNLTPAKRFLETTRLWKLYIALGGNLDPEPDPQSPFYPQRSSS
jgi:hypothetical protein